MFWKYPPPPPQIWQHLYMWLTNWGLVKMATIFLALSWMKIIVFDSNFPEICSPENTSISSDIGLIMNHPLFEPILASLLLYICVTGAQWVKSVVSPAFITMTTSLVPTQEAMIQEPGTCQRAVQIYWSPHRGNGNSAAYPVNSIDPEEITHFKNIVS